MPAVLTEVLRKAACLLIADTTHGLCPVALRGRHTEEPSPDHPLAAPQVTPGLLLVTTEGKTAAGIQRVKARDATQHPAVPRTAPQQTVTRLTDVETEATAVSATAVTLSGRPHSACLPRAGRRHLPGASCVGVKNARLTQHPS